MVPQLLSPCFDTDLFEDLKLHIGEVRRIFEGTPYHDVNDPEEVKFNRWYWHNLKLLRDIHTAPRFIEKASEVFREPVKPSYVFLSMYGEGGVCPLHTDRPQCKYTIDVCISQSGVWPIYVDDVEFRLGENSALAYSGTDSPHYRNTIAEGNFCNLAFFHFVPIDFELPLD